MGKKSAKEAASVVDRTSLYALAVVSGEIVAGRAVRLACERHLRDLETGAARGFGFDVGKANRAMKFIETLCCLSGGEHEGKPFLLQPWECFIVGCLFGWVEAATGFRRFRHFYGEVGKGNGKSPLVAAIVIYMTIADDPPEPRAEAYVCASKKDQAGVLFRDLIAILDQSPELAGQFQRSGAPGREWNLAHFASGSFIRLIATDGGRGQSGPKVHVAVLDELHEHRDAAMSDLMTAGKKGRRQPLTIEITNSGQDPETVCYEHHDYSIRILEQAEENDEWFAYVCQLDACDKCRKEGKTQPQEGCANCDNWRDPATWIKANPNLGISVTDRYLAGQVREAQGMASKRLLVKRLNFCIWVQDVARWMDMDLWAGCGGLLPQYTDGPRLREAALAGKRCYGGLDMSSRGDLTSFHLLFPATAERPTVESLVWFWCPEEGIVRRSREDHVQYDAWADSGFLRSTPGTVIDYDRVRAEILEICDGFDVGRVGFDPYNATQIVTQLQAGGLEMVTVRQGYLTLSPATKELERLISRREFGHGGHPVLRWNAANAAVATDPAGNIKLLKSNQKKRIDGISAAVNAMDQLTRVPDGGESVYESRGMVRL